MLIVPVSLYFQEDVLFTGRLNNEFRSFLRYNKDGMGTAIQQAEEK